MKVNGEHIGDISENRIFEISIQGLFDRNKDDLLKAKELGLIIKLNRETRAILISGSFSNIRLISDRHNIVIEDSIVNKIDLRGEVSTIAVKNSAINRLDIEKCFKCLVQGKDNKFVNINKLIICECENIRVEHAYINNLEARTEFEILKSCIASAVVDNYKIVTNREIGFHLDYAYIKTANLYADEVIVITSYESNDRCVSAVENMICNAKLVNFDVSTTGISEHYRWFDRTFYHKKKFSLADLRNNITGLIQKFGIVLDDNKEFKFEAICNKLVINRIGWVQILESSTSNIVAKNIKLVRSNGQNILKLNDTAPCSLINKLGKIDVIQCNDDAEIIMCKGDTLDVKEAYNLSVMVNNTFDYQLIVRDKLEDNLDDEYFQPIYERLKDVEISVIEDSRTHKTLLMHNIKTNIIEKVNRTGKEERLINKRAMLGLNDASEIIKKLESIDYVPTQRIIEANVFGEDINIPRNLYDYYLIASTIGVEISSNNKERLSPVWSMSHNEFKVELLREVDKVHNVFISIEYKDNNVLYNTGDYMIVDFSSIEGDKDINNVIEILDSIERYEYKLTPILKCGTNYKGDGKKLAKLVDELISEKLACVETDNGSLIFIGDIIYLLDSEGKITRDKGRVDEFIAKYKSELRS